MERSPLLQQVLNKLEKVTRPDAQGWVTALCVFHNDREHPNLRVKDGGFKCMACGEKGSLRELASKLGIEPPSPRTKQTIEKTYDYFDASGRLLFQVVRYSPKDFSQRRPNGPGNWIWNLEGITPVLYNLPALVVADPATTVYVVEGGRTPTA